MSSHHHVCRLIVDINSIESTTFPFAVSLDSDIAFAVLSNSTMKDVVMPDDLIDSSDALRKLIQ